MAEQVLLWFNKYKNTGRYIHVLTYSYVITDQKAVQSHNTKFYIENAMLKFPNMLSVLDCALATCM